MWHVDKKIKNIIHARHGKSKIKKKNNVCCCCMLGEVYVPNDPLFCLVRIKIRTLLPLIVTVHTFSQLSQPAAIECTVGELCGIVCPIFVQSGATISLWIS
jgi:hypothetical protein